MRCPIKKGKNMSKIMLNLNDNEVEIEYEVHTDVLIPENKKVVDINIIDCPMTVLAAFGIYDIEDMIREKLEAEREE